MVTDNSMRNIYVEAELIDATDVKNSDCCWSLTSEVQVFER